MSGSSYSTSGLIPTNQYDSRESSSAFDAVILALLHNTQFGLARKLRCGALLSDIQGFFDDIKNNRLVALVRRLGFLLDRVPSFLEVHTVRLHFNELTADHPFRSGRPAPGIAGFACPFDHLHLPTPLLRSETGWWIRHVHAR